MKENKCAFIQAHALETEVESKRSCLQTLQSPRTSVASNKSHHGVISTHHLSWPGHRSRWTLILCEYHGWIAETGSYEWGWHQGASTFSATPIVHKRESRWRCSFHLTETMDSCECILRVQSLREGSGANLE